MFLSIAYIEFKSEEQAEKYLEQAQGADVQGRSILVDFVGSKSQQNKQGGRAGKHALPLKRLCNNNLLRSQLAGPDALSADCILDHTCVAAILHLSVSVFQLKMAAA